MYKTLILLITMVHSKNNCELCLDNGIKCQECVVDIKDTHTNQTLEDFLIVDVECNDCYNTNDKCFECYYNYYPSPSPTQQPTMVPTLSPIQEPTHTPSMSPSMSPTEAPVDNEDNSYILYVSTTIMFLTLLYTLL